MSVTAPQIDDLARELEEYLRSDELDSKIFMGWTDGERRVWRVQERLTCSEWCERYYHLVPPSQRLGLIDLDMQPWQRGILDAYSDPHVRKIAVKKSVQCGVTTLVLAMVCFTLANGGGDILYALPKRGMAERFALKRWKRTIDGQPAMQDLRTGRKHDETKAAFVCRTGVIWWRNGKSREDLASDPCRIQIAEETDKFDAFTGVEGNPLKLLEDRGTTFPQSKLVMQSTPTLPDGPISKEFEKGDQRRYCVPCPKCSHYQHLRLSQVKVPKDKRAEYRQNLPKLKADRAAFYECEQCRHHIPDSQRSKDAMLKRGVWVQKGAAIDRDGVVRGAYDSTFASFHISTLYAPNAWVSWSDLLAEFWEVKDTPSDLQVFVNQKLGEVWTEGTTRTNRDEIKKARRSYKAGTVPPDVAVLVAGVDVQKDHYWMVVRGYGSRKRSWLIGAYRIDSWRALFARLEAAYDGLHIERAFIDSGDGNRTFEIYDKLYAYRERFFPTKGMSHEQAGIPLKSSEIGVHWRTGRKLPEGQALRLYTIATNAFKNDMMRLIRPVNDEAQPDEAARTWFLPDDVPEAYVDQMIAEERVKETVKSGKSRGSVYYRWKLREGHAQNHFFDCEVSCSAAAHALQLDTLEDWHAHEARELARRAAEVVEDGGKSLDDRREELRARREREDEDELWRAGDSEIW